MQILLFPNPAGKSKSEAKCDWVRNWSEDDFMATVHGRGGRHFLSGVRAPGVGLSDGQSTLSLSSPRERLGRGFWPSRPHRNFCQILSILEQCYYQCNFKTKNPAAPPANYSNQTAAPYTPTIKILDPLHGYSFKKILEWPLSAG